MEFGQFYLADACQLVINLLLFHLELLSVRQLLPFATATHTEVLAEGLRAYLTIFMVTDYLGFHERVLFATYLQVDDIARYSPRHKDYHVVDPSQRLAFSCKIRYFDLF